MKGTAILFGLLIAILSWSCGSGGSNKDPAARANLSFPSLPTNQANGVESGRLSTPVHAPSRRTVTLGFPTRMAEAPDGRIYVSDAKNGTVIAIDQGGEVTSTLAGLSRPMGIAVDSLGRVYVGDAGPGCIVVYGADGQRITTFADGEHVMPSDLTLDREDRLYVVDSALNRVRIYTLSGALVLSMDGTGVHSGEATFDFPSAVAVGYRVHKGREVGELYVADQRRSRIRVFDLTGAPLRSFGSRLAAFSTDWKGRFVRLQSLALHPSGRLLVLDSYLSKVQLLDPITGDYVAHRGAFGTAPGELNLPLDILYSSTGELIVANAGNGRVEVMGLPAALPKVGRGK